MRQFETTYLFRATVQKRNNFEKPHPPIYLIAANEKEAKDRALYYIKKGFELKSISKLGRQYGDSFVK